MSKFALKFSAGDKKVKETVGIFSMAGDAKRILMISRG